MQLYLVTCPGRVVLNITTGSQITIHSLIST